MKKQTNLGLAALTIAAIAVLIALQLRNRRQFVNRVRYFNKHVLNRATLKIAGAPISPISIVRHIGRHSGKLYETPVIVEPVPDRIFFSAPSAPRRCNAF